MNKSLRIVLAMAALLTGLGTARAQDNLDYYWVQTSGNNWDEVQNWRVLRAATPTAPAEYVVPSELPDETNAVFINGVTPPGAAVPAPPVSIPANAPATVEIGVGTVDTAPLEEFPFKARSINFGGTIPATTTVNFSVNQPLAVFNNVVANYRVVIRSNSRLRIDGTLTFNNAAAGAALNVNEATTIAGAVAVNAAATITADNTLTMGSLSFAAPVAGTQPRLNVNRLTTVNGAVTVNSPTTIITQNTFTANSLTFNNGAGASTFTVNQQPATITDALTVGSGATITANRKLSARTLSVSAAATIAVNDTLQVGTTITVSAAAGISTGSNGLLLASALSFNAPSGASLVSNGTVNIANAVNVNAPTTITVNKNFSAGSLSFAGTEASTFTVGRAAAPAATPPVTAITGASASIAGALSVGSPALITTHPGNSLSIGGTLSFTNAGARFNINGAVTLGGSLTLQVPANIANAVNASGQPTGSVKFASASTENAINVTALRPNATPVIDYGVNFNVPVTLSGGGQWTLGTNMIVSQQVIFDNGYLVAPTYEFTRPSNNTVQVTNARVLVFTSAATAFPSGASPNSHVIGFVRKQAFTGTIELPVGAGIVNGIKLFRPITGILESNNNVTARYFNANPKTALGPNNPATSGLTDISDREYWFITSNDNNGLKVSLNYNRPNFPNENPPSDQYYFMNDPRRRNMLTVAGWRPGPGWSDRNAGRAPQINTTTMYITGLGSISQNEYVTIASRGTAPLPVRLVSFSAQQLDGQVKLKWQSAEEKNTAYFEVERSADGKNFSPLLTKKAQGNSASLVSYNAIDGSPLGGTSYYRLKMVDLDGTFEHSKMVSVSTEAGVLVRAYPNPSNGREVRFLAPNGDKLVLQSVTDAFGKAVGYEAADVYAEGLYVSFYGSLPAGFYVATLVTDDDKRERVRVKFVVQ